MKVYLAQTDTTVGLLSKDKEKLNRIKNRPINQPILREVDSLDTLKTFVRVPKKFRKVVRRATKTTFIYPNKESFRVIKDEMHLEFLQKFKWFYSTSANRHKEKFDISWAKSVADVVVEDKRGLFEGEASKIIKLGKRRCKRLR
jgi:tRNA A37 threonylcarbamoyladenosine synthetase subunit TsaC/SUA5/YrdC